MAIYYTQILNKSTRKILTGSFSLAGNPLKGNKEQLLELKNVISKLPINEQKIFSVHSSNKSIIFFFQVSEDIIIATIADGRTSNKIIAKYFAEVSGPYFKGYTDHRSIHYEFDETIKSITDSFNKKYNVLVSVEELENTHSALVENLDTLIKRGENIDNLNKLSDKISMEAREMSRKVSRMKINAKIEQYKIYGVITLVLVFLMYLYFRR